MFEPITDEILTIATDAVIWYYNPDEGIPDGEEFFADLSQMQLFVIPVTAGFVYQDSYARTVEFQYAIEHHIPVLPLMQDSELGSDFNRVCGNLHYLDKHAGELDISALSYEEKLKKYLNAVLISDALAQRVRAAFDAYIFLSYRKKDRIYAQQIMRLIHRNEFCRDIAIWYDEFLVPGENFNDAIAAAMEKSILFAMVVTPNLLEIPNYVMTTEYPEALKANKPILPVEALKTDSEEISKLFGGIDSTLSLEDLTPRLWMVLQNIVLQENDSDPVHNFLIGLAYKSGIDVEIDIERALTLINSAAKANLPEAQHLLATIYEMGDGVVPDYDVSLEWKARAVENYFFVFTSEGTFESFSVFCEEAKDYISDLYIWYLDDGLSRIGAAKIAFDIKMLAGLIYLLASDSNEANFDIYSAKEIERCKKCIPLWTNNIELWIKNIKKSDEIVRKAEELISVISLIQVKFLGNASNFYKYVKDYLESEDISQDNYQDYCYHMLIDANFSEFAKRSEEAEHIRAKVKDYLTSYGKRDSIGCEALYCELFRSSRDFYVLPALNLNYS